MQFDYIDHSHKYIDDILYIIRLGLKQRSSVLNRKTREGINTAHPQFLGGNYL